MKWMARGPWPEHFQDVVDDHLHAYCDLHDLDTFDDIAAKIGEDWVSTLTDVAMMDFLSRETGDGNVVDHYLKRRGWKERAVAKAYLKGVRDSVMSLYEVSDIRPGQSFMARDLILEGEPVPVDERSATKTLREREHLAMRIVDVKGRRIIAGGVLPYEPALAEKVIEAIHLCADEVGTVLEEMIGEEEECSEPAGPTGPAGATGPETIEDLSLAPGHETVRAAVLEGLADGSGA